jgi:hypothetical protein
MKTLRTLLCIGGVLAASWTANATPYVSGITNLNGNGSVGGTIQYILNEAPTSAYIIFEDGTSNSITPVVGSNTFSLGSHTSFAIYCAKTGTGTPTQISSDANTLNALSAPRGVTVSKNPNDWRFGRIYVANGVGSGIFMRNADQSDTVFGQGTATARTGGLPFVASSYSPFRVSVGPDELLYIGSTSTLSGGGFLGVTDPDVVSGSLALPGAFTSYAAGQNHTDIMGTPMAFGSTNTGNLNLYALDIYYPTAANDGNGLLQWQIGAGPFPSSVTPNVECYFDWQSQGVDNGLFGLQDDYVSSNYFYIAQDRSNPTIASGIGLPCIFVYTNTGTFTAMQTPQQSLWDSLTNSSQTGVDLFTNVLGISVSPDGNYMAMLNVNGVAYVCTLNNGIPNGNSITKLPGTTTSSSYGSVAFDAADNIYSVSSGVAKLRVYSLGLSTLTVSSNDYTGTNGSFSFQNIIPNVSVLATTPISSENYGTPQYGVFTISRSGAVNLPLTVNYSLSGTATNAVNYGISVSGGTVTIPAGQSSVTVLVTNLESTSVSLPTLTVVMSLQAGTGYTELASRDTVYLANEGPELLTLSAGAAPTMYRGLSNADFATFNITRTGDTNVALTIPGSAITLGGTAVFGTDYLGGPQPVNFATPPSASSPGISINPGDLTDSFEVGLPQLHASYTGNLTIIVSGVSGSGYTFATSTATDTLLDNLNPPEAVIWSDTLSNSADANWNAVFSQNGSSAITLLDDPFTPVVDGASPSTFTVDAASMSYDFDAEFGYWTPYDFVPPTVLGATNALRLTVDKNTGLPTTACGVNLYPNDAPTFAGNFALRFSMNLVTGCDAASATDYLLFGINHTGTNANWWLDEAATGGFNFTNDGVWFTVAGQGGSLGTLSGLGTDFQEMTSTNTGKANSYLPSTGWWVLKGATYGSYKDVFKYPAVYNGSTPAGGGVPNNASGWADTTPYSSTAIGGVQGCSSNVGPWTDVEVRQSNNVISMSLNKTVIFTGANPTPFTSGTIMLGYMRPFDGQGVGGGVYLANLRVVELSPAITTQPTNISVAPGSPATFTVGAIGVGPFTNVWYFGSTPVQTNIVNTGNSDSGSYTIPSVTVGNAGSYKVVVSDSSGSFTSSVATLTVIGPPSLTFSKSYLSGTSLVMLFNTSNGSDTSNSFNLWSSTVVQGPYTNTPAIFTNGPSGGFEAIIPANTNAPAEFYILEQK